MAGPYAPPPPPLFLTGGRAALAGAVLVGVALLAAGGRAGAVLADPPLRTVGRLPLVPPLLLAEDGGVLLAAPPLRTAGRVEPDVLRLPVTDGLGVVTLGGVDEDVVPPRTTPEVVEETPPPPLFFTLLEGLTALVPDAVGGVVLGFALDPVVGLRSNTGRPVPEVPGVTVGRVGETAPADPPPRVTGLGLERGTAVSPDPLEEGRLNGTTSPPEGRRVAVPLTPGVRDPVDLPTDDG